MYDSLRKDNLTDFKIYLLILKYLYLLYPSSYPDILKYIYSYIYYCRFTWSLTQVHFNNKIIILLQYHVVSLLVITLLLLLFLLGLLLYLFNEWSSALGTCRTYLWPVLNTCSVEKMLACCIYYILLFFISVQAYWTYLVTYFILRNIVKMICFSSLYHLIYWVFIVKRLQQSKSPCPLLSLFSKSNFNLKSPKGHKIVLPRNISVNKLYKEHKRNTKMKDKNNTDSSRQMHNPSNEAKEGMKISFCKVHEREKEVTDLNKCYHINVSFDCFTVFY